MTESIPAEIDLYTRNGFAGPVTTMARMQYTPTYSRVEGDYTPRRLEAWQTLPGADHPRGFPIPILESPTTRVELWQRTSDTPYAVRDVFHDQLFCVLDGGARLETDFGVLDLEPLDLVLIPRSVSVRLSDVRSLQLIVLSTENALRLNPENDAVLSPADVDVARPYDDPVGRPGEYELVVRHGHDTTSYFYDYDPLPIMQVDGSPVVQRFNLANVHAISAEEGAVAPPPARLFDGNTDETLAFYLGSRVSGRPPVHHNADYDELGLYVKGPGVFGAMTVPGTIVWVPKGVIHQGPEENVPEGYVAWLIETRAKLELTEAGRMIAKLAETTAFDVHPSARLEPATS